MFHFFNDYSEDIIDLSISKIPYETKRFNKVYWFAYKFNDNVSSKERTDFINYLKGVSKENNISDRDLRKLIEYPLEKISDLINLYDIDLFAYPLSNRSNLVKTMISIIGEYTSRDMKNCCIEFFKSDPKDIEFDWEMFNRENADDLNKYNQQKEYVDNFIMPKIKKCDYFSLAKEVKPKYRKYIKNFLNMPTESIEYLDNKNILVIDDIVTSGSTIQEILRLIGNHTNNCNIFIFSLIGKE